MPSLTASGVMSALFESSQGADVQTQKIGTIDAFRARWRPTPARSVAIDGIR
jgi:hypothetical protein